MSTVSGKCLRLARVLDPVLQRGTILALDHGLTMGVVPGLDRIDRRLAAVDRDALDAIILHQGMVTRLASLFVRPNGPGLIVHLSGATQLSPDADDKRLVCSVEHALRLGADAVSVHVNLSTRTENAMLGDLARVSEACQQWGMPLLAMMYPRRTTSADYPEPGHVAHAIRVAMELGADLVKVPYTGSRATFGRAVADADIPVLVAGGARMDSEHALVELVDDALQAGASGVTFGRNIFQSEHPLRIARGLSALVRGTADVAQTLSGLQENDRAVPRSDFAHNEQLSGTFSVSPARSSACVG